VARHSPPAPSPPPEPPAPADADADADAPAAVAAAAAATDADAAVSTGGGGGDGGGNAVAAAACQGPASEVDARQPSHLPPIVTLEHFDGSGLEPLRFDSALEPLPFELELEPFASPGLPALSTPPRSPRGAGGGAGKPRHFGPPLALRHLLSPLEPLAPHAGRPGSPPLASAPSVPPPGALALEAAPRGESLAAPPPDWSKSPPDWSKSPPTRAASPPAPAPAPRSPGARGGGARVGPPSPQTPPREARAIGAIGTVPVGGRSALEPFAPRVPLDTLVARAALQKRAAKARPAPPRTAHAYAHARALRDGCWPRG
jgi:hypothetical protein